MVNVEPPAYLCIIIARLFTSGLKRKLLCGISDLWTHLSRPVLWVHTIWKQGL
jgi:hypothetical protein